MGASKDWAYERFMSERGNTSPSNPTLAPLVNQIGGERKIVKGRLGDVEFQVNPTTIELGGGKNWSEIAIPGSEVPLMQLGSGKSNTFSFELYINEWMFGKKINANKFVEEIYRCRGSRKPVKFVMGHLVKNVIVNEINITVNSFNPDLSFREVTMTVTLTTVYI